MSLTNILLCFRREARASKGT